MNRDLKSILILVVLLNSIDNATAADKRTQREQSTFSAETVGVTRPAPIPEEVLALLARDQWVANVLRNEGLTPEQAPRSWFSASVIHLSNPNEPDLIVKGEAPLLGANVATYWVFRQGGHGFELLFTASALDLSVMRTSHNHYRDIDVSGKTASEFSSMIYQFNGARYIFSHTSSK